METMTAPVPDTIRVAEGNPDIWDDLLGQSPSTVFLPNTPAFADAESARGALQALQTAREASATPGGRAQRLAYVFGGNPVQLA